MLSRGSPRAWDRPLVLFTLQRTVSVGFEEEIVGFCSQLSHSKLKDLKQVLPGLTMSMVFELLLGGEP